MVRTKSTPTKLSNKRSADAGRHTAKKKRKYQVAYHNEGGYQVNEPPPVLFWVYEFGTTRADGSGSWVVYFDNVVHACLFHSENRRMITKKMLFRHRSAFKDYQNNEIKVSFQGPGIPLKKPYKAETKQPRLTSFVQGIKEFVRSMFSYAPGP